MARTFTEIINELISYVVDGTGSTGSTGGIGNVDTRVGTVLRDAILTPNAFEFTNAYSNVDVVSADQGINTASTQSDASLENLASNYGISRYSGGYATGSIRFFRYVQPNANIQISSGTIVYTELADTRVPFHTLSTVYLTPTSPTDSDLGYYYVDVPIVCDTLGTIGNVAAGAISYTETVGVDGCINLNDITNGTDAQTNDQLVQTITSTARGNLGTKTGYESVVRTNFGVTDVDVITPSDPEATRAQYGGAIDVVILDETETPITGETHIFVNPATTTRITPVFKPMMDVIQIVGEGSTGGPTGPMVLVPGVTGDYEVYYDLYSTEKRSINDSSFIGLHINTFTPNDNSYLVLDYTINATVASVQDFLDADDQKVIGSDVMVKAGIKILVDIAADIRIFSGYNSDSVTIEITSALTALFNSKLLDDDIQASDVIATIATVSGVNSVDTSTFKMAKALAPAIALEEIICNKQEYARLNSVTITVVG